MRKLIAILILFSCSSVLMGQNLDSTHYETKPEDEWVLRNRTHYTYEQSNLLEWDVLLWNTNFEYWTRVLHGTNSYNENGLLDTLFQYQYSSGLGKYGFVRKIYSYNSIDKVDTLIVLEAIPPAWFFWANDYRVRNVYDTNGRLKHSFRDYGFAWDQWNKNIKTSYTYNLQGLPIKFVQERWNSDSNQWEINAKELNTYNASGNILENVRLELEEAFWVNKEKTSSNYNSSGYLSSKVFYAWDELVNEWIFKNEREYTYNSDFSEMQILYSYQHHITGEIIESSRSTYFYSAPLDLIEEQFKPIIMYPNPAKDLVNIKLKNTISTKITLADISGRVVQIINLEEGQEEYQIDISAYSSGIYFIEVFQDGQNVQSEKLIIQ